MVDDHSDSERGNPLPPHGLLFPIRSKGSFICHATDRMTHTTAFVTPVAEHWLKREIAQWVHSMKDRSDDPSHHQRRLLPHSLCRLCVLYEREKMLFITYTFCKLFNSRSEMKLRGKSVRSWCDGSSDRSFMG